MVEQIESCRLLVRGAGEAALTPQTMESLGSYQADGSLVWLDVQDRVASELDRVGERFKFDPAAIEDVLDIEQLPKFDNYGDHLFVVLHALVADGDRLDTHEVDCFVSDRLIVTVHSEPIPGLDWLWTAVQEHPHMAEHGTDEIFAQLAEVIGRRYLEVVDAIEVRVDRLADGALDADPSVLADIQLLRREEATVRRVLRPQRMVIGSLRASGQPIIGAEATKLLTDAFDVHNLVVESLVATRGLLTDTLDTYRGASAERQANATTVLTVYAAILLPLTLITGWYGMNMSNLPGANSRWGWVAVTAAMAAIAIASWVLFVRAGMVQSPRIRSGRRIASGLAEVAKAPVRPFTMLRRSTRTDD